MPFYIPDREPYVLSCDTMTVEYGDTTAILGGGSVCFRWDKGLDTFETVLLIKGRFEGDGRLEIKGPYNARDTITRWGGIIVDTCASLQLVQLALTGATTPIALKTTRVFVNKLELEGSGALLMPDSSRLSVNPKSDVLDRFNASTLPGIQGVFYNCPEPRYRDPFIAVKRPVPSTKASSWSRSQVTYWTWTSVLGITIVTGLMILMAQNKE